MVFIIVDVVAVERKFYCHYYYNSTVTATVVVV